LPTDSQGSPVLSHDNHLWLQGKDKCTGEGFPEMCHASTEWELWYSSTHS